MAYAKGAEWYETGSKKGQELWKDAGPVFHKTHTSLRVSSFPLFQVCPPQWQTCAHALSRNLDWTRLVATGTSLIVWFSCQLVHSYAVYNSVRLTEIVHLCRQN